MTPDEGQGANYFKAGGYIEEIREEIGKTQTVLADLFGIECRGLTGPWNYYRDLVDRPDILQVLDDAGIRWIRTYGRTAGTASRPHSVSSPSSMLTRVFRTS